jgi:hypothetical protein
MSDTKNKRSGFDYLDPFVFANGLVRISCRASVAVIALAIRIPTSLLLRVIARVRRSRVTRW